MATRERDFAREEAAGLRRGNGEVDGTVEGMDPGRTVAGSIPVGAQTSSDDDEEEEEEEEEEDVVVVEEVVEKGVEKEEENEENEAEVKEEEEKDTESVVDDGGERSVAEEDVEKREEEEESLRFFREFQTSRSARGPDRSPADGNGFCFMDSSSSDSDADADADGNGASAATSSTSSSAEWAERWERKHGGASGGASGAGHAERLDEHSNEHSDDANLRGRRRNGANGRGYDAFHGGDPYGDDDDRDESAALHADDVFGADELAGILNASTRDRMGSVDFSGVARGPCRTCRKRGAGAAGSDPGGGSNPGDGSGSVRGVVAPCFAFASIADWDAGVAVGTSPGTPPLPYLLPENNVGPLHAGSNPTAGVGFSAFDAWRAYEEKVRNLRAELVEAPGETSDSSSSSSSPNGRVLRTRGDDRLNSTVSSSTVFVPGARTCARCGCPAECHATNRELLRAKRQELRECEAARTAESDRLERVAKSAARIRKAKRTGAFMETTHLDCFQRAERGGCSRCGPRACTKFTVVHTADEAVDPNVMAFCSVCGCDYKSHPITNRWRREAAAAEREARARFQRARAARDAARERETREASAVDESDRVARVALGLGETSSARHSHTRRELDRAYRRCALRWHPDKFANDTEAARRDATRRFVEAAEAYRRLLAKAEDA